MKECIRFAPETLSDGIVWLYREGVEFESVTGGWVEGYVNGTGGTITRNTDHLLITPNVQGQIDVVTDSKINLSSLAVLVIEYEVTISGAAASAFRAGESKTDGLYEGGQITFTTSSSGRQIATLNVSSVSTALYVKLFAYITSGSCSFKVYKVWGEK